MSAGNYNLNSFFGTLSSGGMADVNTHTMATTYPQNLLSMFQLTFAIITVALITGAYTERMKHSAVMLFSTLWLVLCYCPLAHMIWSGDGAFFHDLGTLDFAGGLVVHTSSGVAGLLAALCIGKRSGYPRIPHAPHSLMLMHIGGALLWVGWFGFNAGSAGAADYLASQAMLVTMTAGAAGALSWSSTEWLLFGRPSSIGLVSGAIAGLVGITPASGTAGVFGALVIGTVTGVTTLLGSTKLKAKVDLYDDALDAFGIHGIGGITGALLTGIWCAPALGGQGFGTFIHKGGRKQAIDNVGFQLGVQAASVAFAVCWVTIGTLICLKVTDLCHGGWHPTLRLRAIRVSSEYEDMGLDESTFAEQAYNTQPGDLRISVEVGPLRGREGHGLLLSMTDSEGTKHSVDLHADAKHHDALSEQLLASGGVVQILGAPGSHKTEVSLHGGSRALELTGAVEGRVHQGDPRGKSNAVLE